MGRVIHGKVLIKGIAAGPLLVGNAPLSFWGGYSQFTGEIIDRRHPLSGKVAAGCILAVPASRGSSTTTAVLLEAVRRGTAPAALITSETDTFLVLASVVADELYQKPIPVLAIQAEEFETLVDSKHAELTKDGSLRIAGPN